MNVHPITIKNLHNNQQLTTQNSVDNLIASLANKLGDNAAGLNADELNMEINTAINKLQNPSDKNKKTEYLENAFSLIDAISPFQVNIAKENVLTHIKSLLNTSSYFINNSINFQKDVSSKITNLVQQNVSQSKFKQELHKIHIDSNDSFKAPITQISSLKNKMLTTLKNIPAEHQTRIKNDIILAITDKNIGNIPANDPIWIKDTRDNSIRKPEANILNKIFPDIKSLEEYTNLMELYTNSPQTVPDNSYQSGLDIFIKSNGAHPYFSWVRILCEKMRLDSTKIALNERTQHFYIVDKPETFIPNDNDCAFHCIQYLLETK